MIVDVALYQEGKRVEASSDISDLVDRARSEGGFCLAGFSRTNAKRIRHGCW